MLVTFIVPAGVAFTEEQVQKHFDEFFADIYLELEEKVGYRVAGSPNYV